MLSLHSISFWENIVDVSNYHSGFISPFYSEHIGFKYFKALFLGAYTFIIVMSF